jgi:hypothetical protein
MNTSNLNESRVSNFQTNRDLLDMDVSKIREFIKLLQEHQDKCEEGGRFVEAEMAKQRVAQFKKIESQKMLRDLRASSENKKRQIEEEHKIELDTFNEDMDKRYYELNDRYEEHQKVMADQFEQEINKTTENFNQEHPVHHKDSAEALNLQKMLEHLVKQKEYAKAHQIQQKIADLHVGEKDKWEAQKQANLDRAIEKLRQKQENEKQHYHKKMSQIFTEFKKNRAIETEKIIQKYKNKLKEAENHEKTQTNEFHRPMKTGMKNSPYRPNSTQKNTTGGGFMNVKG